MGNKFSLNERELARGRLEEREKKEKRTCKGCGKERTLKEFRGRIIKHLTFLQVSFLNTCGECFSKKNVTAVAKARREDENYARACTYWRRSRKKGIRSDLKLRDIRMMLRSDCQYCETREAPMTLDRKDNSGGYVRSNTVPCCVRCNTIKSDMPWEAWERMIPAIRNVVKLGLFRDWRLETGGSKMRA